MVVVAVIATGAVHVRLGCLLCRAMAWLMRCFMRMVVPMIMFVVMAVVVVVSLVPGMSRVVVRAVPMRMAAGAVGTAFRFKRFIHLMHDQMHGPQHVGQNMVGLYLQVIGLELDGHMAIAQVVGGAGQVKGGAMVAAMRDAQDRLRRGQHLDHGAVFSNQHITTAHQCAARQKYAKLAVKRVGRVETALLAHVPVEFDGCCAFDQHRCQAGTARNNF